MDLDELNEIKNLNELDLLYKIVDVIEAAKKDTERVLKGEKIPGIRVRSKLQDAKLLCEIIRDKIQMRKGSKWSKCRVFSLDKAIKDAIKKLEKDTEIIAERKAYRISKLMRRNAKKI